MAGRVEQCHPTFELLLQLEQHGSKSVSAQGGAGHASLRGKRPLQSLPLCTRLGVHDEADDGHERRPFGHLQQRQPLPRAGFHQPLRDMGVNDLDRKAQRRDSSVDQAGNIAVRPLRLTFRIELGSVGQQQTALAEPGCRILQIRAVSPRQRLAQHLAVRFGAGHQTQMERPMAQQRLQRRQHPPSSYLGG